MGKNKIERIKNLIIRFLKYIKGTRRRTKVLYFGILVFIAMFLSIRVGEIMAPVRVTYHVTGGINGIDEKYSVYKEGFNYYLELSVADLFVCDPWLLLKCNFQESRVLSVSPSCIPSNQMRSGT